MTTYTVPSAVGYAVLYASLAAFFIAAVIARRYYSPKGASADQYLSARRSIGWLNLGFSFYAGAMGASVLFVAPEVGATSGWLGVLGYAVGGCLPMWVLLWLGPRMRALVGETGFSLTDWVRQRFGRPLQMYVSLISFAYMGALLTAGYHSGAIVLVSCAGVSMPVAVVSLAAVTCAYSALGGLAASLFTDSIQGAASGLLMLLAVVAGCTAVEVQPSDWAAAANWETEGVQSMCVLILAILAAELFNMAGWQRVWASTDASNLRKGLLLGSAMLFVTMMGLGVFGMLAEAQDMGRTERELDSPDLKSLAFFNVLQSLGQGWVVLVMVLTLCLCASSVDSVQTGLCGLIAAAVVHRPWGLTLTRLFLVAINVPAVLLACCEVSVLKLFFIADLFAATIALPVFLGLVPRVTAWGSMAGCLAGLLSIVLYGALSGGSLAAGFELFLLPDPTSSLRTLLAFVVALGGSGVVTVAVSLLGKAPTKAVEAERVLMTETKA